MRWGHFNLGRCPKDICFPPQMASLSLLYYPSTKPPPKPLYPFLTASNNTNSIKHVDSTKPLQAPTSSLAATIMILRHPPALHVEVSSLELAWNTEALSVTTRAPEEKISEPVILLTSNSPTQCVR